MSERTCFLQTANDGKPTGKPFLILHDRYEDLEDAQRQGEALGTDALRIAVRSLRTQTVGGRGETHGYFWYIGPVENPELSTLGEGLSQLEAAFLNAADALGSKIGLYGKGEGATMAFLLALIWPEKISHLILEDIPNLLNFDRMPITIGPVSDFMVTLIDNDIDRLGSTIKQLKDVGARVYRASGCQEMGTLVA